jgi:hypothetical protein
VEISTAKDIANISHRARMESAKSAAAITGGMSFVKNIVVVVQGEKEADEALLSIAKDTGTGFAVGYGTAFAGSVIKGGMQNAGDATVRALSKSNLLAMYCNYRIGNR